MKNFWVWLGLIAFVGTYTACSGVRFSKQVDVKQFGNACQQQSDSKVFCEGTEFVSGGKVDVLIVNDNSASMSFEQARLADRFNKFINLLDGKSMDYRIAVTTTDISSSTNLPRAINQNGALQDGNLIAFPFGGKYVTQKDGDLNQRTAWFNTVIKRKETLDCEAFIVDWVNSGKSLESTEYTSQYVDKCPPTDERGIYAANTVLQKNPDSFIRPEADLAIVFLADEDVRSQLYHYNYPGYELSEMDKAATLVSNIKTLFPGKAFGVHAIIVKDASCLSQQNAQTQGIVNGSYGWEYHNAVQQAKTAMNAMGFPADVTSKMVSGDICAGDYTAQLNQIFDNINGQVKDSITLGCENPTELVVTLSTSDASITHSVVGTTLKFNKKLPVGTSVSYRYSCPI